MKSIPVFLFGVWFCLQFAGCGGTNGTSDASEDAMDAILDAGIDGADELHGQDSFADESRPGDDGGLDAGADLTDSDISAQDGADSPADEDVVYELDASLPDGWQRGPVRLAITVHGPSGEFGRISVAWSDDQLGFKPATVLAGTMAGLANVALSPSGTEEEFVWDSKRDLDRDLETVFLRVTLRVDARPVASVDVGPIPVLDARDRDRLLVVAHPYAVDQEGKPIPGDKASVLKLLSDGSIVDTGQDVECGSGPLQAMFSADGRYLVLLGDGPGHNHHSLKTYRVQRDGALVSLGPPIELFDLDLSCSDMVPARDGSGLWLLRSSGVGGLFYLSLEAGEPRLLQSAQGDYYLLPITLPSAMAILADNQRAILSGGALVSDDPPYDVTLVDLFSLSILDQVDMGLEQLSESVAVTPDGKYALMPSGDYGEGGSLWMVGINGDHIGQGSSVAVPSPAKVKIHPQGGAAIVTSWYPGSIKTVDLSGGVPKLVESFDGIGLADYLSCVNEGSLEGLCVTTATSAATGVSSVVPVMFNPDASAELLPFFDFGDGYTSIASGPAIQP